MGGADTDRALQVERRMLQRASRLRWFHWVILALSLALTLLAWQMASRASAARAENRFERQSEQVVGLFAERLHGYADLLLSASGLILASDEVTDAEWHRYADVLRLAERFPALTGFGVMERVTKEQLPAYVAERQAKNAEFVLRPEHEQPIHLPMVHVTPRRLEPRALGLDLAHEPRRHAAAQEALRSGTVQITAPVRPSARDAKGFLMFAPFYREPVVDAERRTPGHVSPFAGALVASVLVEDIVDGILDKERRQLWVSLSDDGETIHDERDPEHPLTDPEPLFSRVVDVPMFGRLWRFEIESNLAFRRDAASYAPAFILAGGLFVETLLLGLFLMLSRSNRRALSFARRAGESLRAESEALEESNRELETFAYVVSHDLKTPLNGIGYLADFIEEDLAEHPDVERVSPDVGRNVERIQQQVRRAQALIDGILEYSGLGTGEERSTPVDTRKLVESIGETLGVGPERLELDGVFPVLETCETRLSQVLSNLLGNAFKYHHDVERARVRVSIEPSGPLWRFSVSDDGPGIDPAYHARIFELFETLGTREGVDGTGIGLAIVKKTVEQMGGTIELESAPGKGTRFTFGWPGVAAEGNNAGEEALPKAA